MAAPLKVIEIPLDGFYYAGLECFHWLPTQLILDFSGIDGIAEIMSRSVFDISDQLIEVLDA